MKKERRQDDTDIRAAYAGKSRKTSTQSTTDNPPQDAFNDALEEILTPSWAWRMLHKE